MTAASADLRKLAKDLEYASKQGIRKATAKVIRETAEKVQDRAIAYAPRDTGKLAASIIVRHPEPTQAVIGPTVEYGVYQEFGTGTRGEFHGAPRGGRRANLRRKVATGRQTGVPPQPFMRPAVKDALQPATKEMLKNGTLLITKGPRSTQ